MIIEFPQADTFCGVLSLRLGVIIVVVIRIIFLVLIVLFCASVFPTVVAKKDDVGIYELCFNSDYNKTVALVLLVVTVTFVVLWIVIMVPAVLLEALSAVLVGCLFEIIIWTWFLFLLVFHMSMCIIGNFVDFMVIYSLVWMVLECYVLWLMWSYYVDLKAEQYMLRSEEARHASTESDNQTSTY